MAGQLLNAALLLALCVLVHAQGTVVMLRRILHLVPHAQSGEARKASIHLPLLHLTVIFIQIFFLHVVEMALWAGAYWVQGAFPTFEESLYFSIVSFTTVGYGDVVLPVDWRILGAAEAATGNLLLGWSTGLMFMLIQRIYRDLVRTPSSK
jgi:voltage-gated potassium channel